jgi:hypothetical protein
MEKIFACPILCLCARESMEKGREMQVCHRKTQKNRASKLILDFNANTSFCQIRFVPFPPSTVLSLYDKKEILITLHPKEELPVSPTLWSSNPSILAAMQDYFDILWITAMEIPEYYLDNIQA